ncbi:uncharacterized protein UTRI_03312_B [Ustilago trichophora]|uniref:Uncharacterized protein n=1 Tax=Ustilago trichophora TaxID=86804 RepID=A0A5C3E4F7_9BASI|nr:uncharacterized protein UTRI_03312_B [Ustilago trichophora]
MHIKLFFPLAFLLVSIGLVFAEMPSIVAKLPETQALWHYLENRGYLPGRFVRDGLQGLPTDPWHAFLKQRGNEIIGYHWDSVVEGQAGWFAKEQIKALKSFVNSPKTEWDPYLTSRIPARIGRRIITEYAGHLDKNPHLVAVNEYHRLPNTAEALLWN